MRFDLTPNVGLLPLAIGASLEEVSAVLGQILPDRCRIAGEDAIRSTDATVRVVFRAGRVVEVSVCPPHVVAFEGFDLFNGSVAWKRLVALEPNPHEVLGFLVLKSLSVTLGGLHDGDVSQVSVSMFEPGRWDEMHGEMNLLGT